MAQQPAPAPAPATGNVGPGSAAVRWQRTPEVELMGRAQDSGLKADTFLIKRGDGQIVQLSGLLHTVLQEIDPAHSPEQIAGAVSSAYGKTLDTDGLSYLITKYLTVLGLVEIVGAPKPAAAPPRARTIMSLTARATLIPARVVRPISRLLAPLYHPVLVVIALGLWMGLGTALMVRGDLAQSLDDVLQTPLLVLVMMIALGACAIVHELGHATATAYGGARPGRIGVGIYIVFFAYFTDVSDSYRLNRPGRVRVDLGGLYFNVLTAIGLAIGYFATGSGFLLLMILVLHIQMSQQLLPTGRFDGYYLLGDISGVPDLFARAKPALQSLLPRGDKSGVADLKPWVRIVVVAWAVVVVPLLLGMLGFLLWSLPTLVRTTWGAGGVQIERLLDAVARGEMSVAILAVLSVIVLALPLIGITVILWRISSSLVRWAWRSWRSTSDAPSSPGTAIPPHSSRARRTAEESTDEQMLSPIDDRPRRGH